jgi:hypothetical protein
LEEEVVRLDVAMHDPEGVQVLDLMGVVLQWCYSGATVVLQWCHSGVTVVLQY